MAGFRAGIVRQVTIGELTRIVGRSPRTVRYWEQVGRIAPAHRDLVSGRRWWTEGEAEDLRRMVQGDELELLPVI